eukprot:1145650-Pelagomonas_calceolata.AAC.2
MQQQQQDMELRLQEPMPQMLGLGRPRNVVPATRPPPVPNGRMQPSASTTLHRAERLLVLVQLSAHTDRLTCMQLLASIPAMTVKACAGLDQFAAGLIFYVDLLPNNVEINECLQKHLIISRASRSGKVCKENY